MLAFYGLFGGAITTIFVFTADRNNVAVLSYAYFLMSGLTIAQHLEAG